LVFSTLKRDARYISAQSRQEVALQAAFFFYTFFDLSRSDLTGLTDSLNLVAASEVAPGGEL
jgi:hypothetical protein